MKENDALAECIRHDPSGDLYRNEERIMRLEGEERCVRRAMWLMALLSALTTACSVYSAILLHDLAPYYTRLINHSFSIIGLASIISLIMFAGVWFYRRRQITTCREEVHRLILKLLAERSSGGPRTSQERRLLSHS